MINVGQMPSELGVQVKITKRRNSASDKSRGLFHGIDVR